MTLVPLALSGIATLCSTALFTYRFDRSVIGGGGNTIARGGFQSYAPPAPLAPLTALSDSVLSLDAAVLRNVRATYASARSLIEGLPSRATSHFEALPLLATVDRRPIVVRKQLLDDAADKQLAREGDLLGCAVSAATFVSNLESQDLADVAERDHSCSVCFQFSSREDMANFVPSSGEAHPSISTKCFRGEAALMDLRHMPQWQKNVTIGAIDVKKGERADFSGYGYPWTIDCLLPSGIEELTCREITRRNDEMVEGRDGLRSISFETKLLLRGTFGIQADIEPYKFAVTSRWPWEALQSHDDDRSGIARRLSKRWDDTSSGFVPKDKDDLKLAHVEGPGYDLTSFEGRPTLTSMASDPTSLGGVHPKFSINLFHLIRNGPGTTHIVAVVDGQAKRSFQHIRGMLEKKISEIYPEHWRAFGSLPREELNGPNTVSLLSMKEEALESSGGAAVDMTLRELLRLRRIKIQIVPILAPSLVIEKSVCGGQYAFASYLAARYAADYHVVIYADGDTVFVEGRPSTSLKGILYNTFFDEEESERCAGHRFKMIEQYVRPDLAMDTGAMLRCTFRPAISNPEWKRVVERCIVAEGHIVARTDSIYQFNLHHVDTLEKQYLPEGVKNCWSGEMGVQPYEIGHRELVQIHLRNRERKPECACFVDP